MLPLIFVQSGQPSSSAEEEEIEFHYIAFIPHNNRLCELNGLSASPVTLRSTTNDSFVKVS